MPSLPRFQQKHFFFAVLAGISLSLLACIADSTSRYEANQQSLQQAVQRWESNKPSHYRYSLYRSCFCPDEYTGPFLVEANRDSLTQVRRIQPNYPATSEGVTTYDTLAVTGDLKEFSMDSVFALAQSFLTVETATVTFQFNTTYGYPEGATLRMPPTVADGFAGVSVTEFVTAED
jgi:Family of unknown function (DUF6174)